MSGNWKKSGSNAQQGQQRMKKMCCGLWLTKRDEAAGESRKIADKGMQIKAGMENGEEDIAQRKEMQIKEKPRDSA